MNRKRLATALLLSVLAASSRGHAEPEGATSQSADSAQPMRVLLLASDTEDPLVARVAAELRSLRFEVIFATTDSASPSGPELEALARAQGAVAAVQVAVLDGSIDLWLVNADTHEVLYRRIVSDSDPAVAAFRSLEILRGSLIDLQALAPRRAAKSKPAIPTPGPKPNARSRPRSLKSPPLTLQLGGAVAVGRQVTPAWYALASIGVALDEHWALNGFALVPVSSATIRGEGGYALLTSGFLGGGMSFKPLRHRVIMPSLGVGVAGAILQTRGVPDAGFSGRTQRDFSAFPHGRLDLSVALGDSFRARAQLLGGSLVPRPVVLFAGKPAGSWGAPLLIAALGLELVFG